MSRRGWITFGVLVWAWVIIMNVVMTKLGAPQQVWMFCDMMKLCN